MRRYICTHCNAELAIHAKMLVVCELVVQTGQDVAMYYSVGFECTKCRASCALKIERPEAEYLIDLEAVFHPLKSGSSMPSTLAPLEPNEVDAFVASLEEMDPDALWAELSR